MCRVAGEWAAASSLQAMGEAGGGGVCIIHCSLTCNRVIYHYNNTTAAANALCIARAGGRRLCMCRLQCRTRTHTPTHNIYVCVCNKVVIAHVQRWRWRQRGPASAATAKAVRLRYLGRTLPPACPPANVSLFPTTRHSSTIYRPCACASVGYNNDINVK